MTPESPDTPPEGEAAVTGDFSGVFTGVSGLETGISGLGAETPAWKLQHLFHMFSLHHSSTPTPVLSLEHQ